MVAPLTEELPLCKCRTRDDWNVQHPDPRCPLFSGKRERVKTKDEDSDDPT